MASYPAVQEVGHGGVAVEGATDGAAYLSGGAPSGSEEYGPGVYPAIYTWSPGVPEVEEISAEGLSTPRDLNYAAGLAAQVAAKADDLIDARDGPSGAAGGSVMSRGVDTVAIEVEKEKGPPPKEEILIEVPGESTVFLVADKDSPLLGKGPLVISRIHQGEASLMVTVKVGESLSWLMAPENPVNKVAEKRYIFSVVLPMDDEDEEDSSHGSGMPPKSPRGSLRSIFSWGKSKKKEIKEKKAPEGPKVGELVSYGLTLPESTSAAVIAKLDEVLTAYSPKFSNNFALSQGASAEASATGGSAKVQIERTEEFWKQVAPNVDEYNSSIAKEIARVTGWLITGLVWSSDVAASKMLNVEEYMKSGKQGKQDAKMSGTLKFTVRRIRKFSKMTDGIASGMLSGMLRVTGFFTGAALKSSMGRAFIKMLPGEVLIVSLDAFGKLCDALEISSKNVLETGSVVTSNVVAHKYGKDAGEVVLDVSRTGGHVLHTAWTISKIRNVLNPKAALTEGGVGSIAAAAATTAKYAHQVEGLREEAAKIKGTTRVPGPGETDAAVGGITGQLAQVAVDSMVGGKGGKQTLTGKVAKLAVEAAVKKLSKDPKAAAAGGEVAKK